MKKLIKIGKLGIIPAIIFRIVSCCPPEIITEEVASLNATGTANIQHVDEDFTQSCSECHSDITPEIYSDWKSSGHGKLNYGCYICHGDGLVEFYPTAHTDGCISCHSSKEPHLARFEYTGCFDCHNGHTLSAN